jgi:hypothetical protein
MWKNPHLYYFLPLLMGILFFAFHSDLSAQSFGLNSGGRVTTVLPLYCTGGAEVFFLKGAKGSPSGMFSISAASRRYMHYTVTPGRLILGKYFLTPVPCFSGTPPAPAGSAFLITLFGTSAY